MLLACKDFIMMIWSETKMKRKIFIVFGAVVAIVMATQYFLTSNMWSKKLKINEPLQRTSEVNGPLMHQNLNNEDQGKQMAKMKTLPKIFCKPDVPCEYNAEVDLRVIVMVFDRSESLRKVLESLQHLEVDSDTAILEIWIDRSKKTGGADQETVKVAEAFQWNKGSSRVNIHQRHVGIYGQWIDTWRPKENSKEIALFLEDDVDVSPYAYRWLKAAINKYGASRQIAGYSIFEGAIFKLKDNSMPKDHVAFLHQRMGSQGMAPDANHWRDFQDWYHGIRKDPTFHPYVHDDPDVTMWYKTFQKAKKANSMWSIWYIYYNDKHNLLTLYSNIGKVMHTNNASMKADQYLAFHRKEKGLHFTGKPMTSKTRLITYWDSSFLNFPSFESLYRFTYQGKTLQYKPVKIV